MRLIPHQENKYFRKIFTGLLLFVLCFSLVPNAVQAGDDPADPSAEFDQLFQYINESDTGSSLSMLTSQRDELHPIENNQIELFSIQMPQFDGRDKSVVILLPPDYFTSQQAYPVFYLQGAEEFFIKNRIDGESWFLDESLYPFFTDVAASNAIIVGLFSDPIHHWEEYGPWENNHMYLWVDPYEANRSAGGDADAYLDFMVDTLKPEIDQRYRTLQSRENTTIGGYEMGGLFSLYAGLMRPDVYSKVGALSPTIWFAERGGTWLSNNHLLNLINERSLPEGVSFAIEVDDARRTMEVDVRPVVNDNRGNRISFPQAYLEGIRALVEALLANGLPEKAINNGNFNLDAWAQNLPQPLLTRSLDYETYFPIFFNKGLDHFDITIPFHNRARRIWVYLPPDYFRTTQSYPVIYLLDAQHVFGAEAGANISDLLDWKFDETLDTIYETTGKGIIAVAIEFDSFHPYDEYMPWTNYNMDNWLNNTTDVVNGKGNQLLNFIIDDLKPIIDSNYRTLPGREHTGIGGGSRVALFSLYAGLKRPDVFSKIMAMSPAVWLAEGGGILPPYLPYWLETNQFVKYIGSFTSSTIPKNVKFYLYIGRQEDSGPGSPYPFVLLRDGTQLTMPLAYQSGANAIRKPMQTKGANVKFVDNWYGTHYPSVWRNYVKSALNWLGY